MPTYHNLSMDSEHGIGSPHHEILPGQFYPVVDKKYFNLVIDIIVRFANVAEYHMTSSHFLPGCA